MKLTLVSHKTCPFVQRAVIALNEKGVDFERKVIDLTDKPDWFLKISPLGRVPVLLVDDTPIFESAVIAEFLEETQPKPLHPSDPITRAHNRAWIEFGSTMLADTFMFYTATDEETFESKRLALIEKFERLEGQLGDGPFFNGAEFALVDAALAPIFRTYVVFEEVKDFGFFTNTPKLNNWRKALMARSSVQSAVDPDFLDVFKEGVKKRGSIFGRMLS